MIFFKKFLNRSIPYPLKFKAKLSIALFWAIIFYGFLNYYTPFHYDNAPTDVKSSLLIYFVIQLFVLLIFNMLLFPKFKKGILASGMYKNKHLIVQMIIIYLFSEIGLNLFYFLEKFPSFYRIDPFQVLMLYSDLLFFPLLVIANLVNWEKKEIEPIQFSRVNYKKKPQNDIPLKISDENERIVFEINSKDFIYAKSCQNYVEIFYQNGDKISKEVLRITMYKLADVMATDQNILHCHRSYIVNLAYVSKVSKEKTKYRIYLEKINMIIPISSSIHIEEYFK